MLNTLDFDKHLVQEPYIPEAPPISCGKADVWQYQITDNLIR
jgi:hypothetical protein